jgi:hypothetical protein
MLRRNLDFFAIAAIFSGMALVQHIPPPSAVAAASAIHFQDAVVHDRCPLMDRILALF